jgi:hypothetical protein
MPYDKKSQRNPLAIFTLVPLNNPITEEELCQLRVSLRWLPKDLLK